MVVISLPFHRCCARLAVSFWKRACRRHACLRNIIATAPVELSAKTKRPKLLASADPR